MKLREFPDWEKLYREEKVESMPWYHPGLDPDLEKALRDRNIRSGAALDLGTGPGTQAMALAELGFEVTATDISETSVKGALKKTKKRGLKVDFRQDDILDTTLDRQFDFIFDRGCFHVIAPGRRKDYVKIVEGLIKPGGYLFLKCFSHLEKMKGGPYRFRQDELRGLFRARFKVLSVRRTVYHGTLDPLPKALFCVIKKPRQ